MATFDLTKGADTYTFDTSGNGAVKKNNAAFGKWSTGASNQLIAAKADGSAQESFVVTWQFNNKNELCLKSGATLLCNFHDDRRPRYDLVNGVLNVKPDFTGQHQFQVRGEWDLDADVKLSFTTPDGAVSTLAGTLMDLRSRFNYRIASKTVGRESHTAQLLFVGRWRKDPADDAKVNFIYKRENGTEDTFVLPGDISFNRGDNQLIYRFNKAGQRHQIDFVGTLRVSPDFQISYSIANQVAQSGASQVVSTEIVIQAVFANPAFQGELALAVKRPGGGETVFALTGNFTAIRLSGSTNLAIGFAISGGTGTTPTTVAIQGTFSFGAGTQLEFTFQHAAKQTTISVAASQIKLGNFAVVDATGTITLANGQLQSVEVMFGITFPRRSGSAGPLLGLAAPLALAQPGRPAKRKRAAAAPKAKRAAQG